MKMCKPTWLVIAFSIGIAVLNAPADEFTWQGQVNDGGSPAEGVYDLKFRLYDIDTGGTPLGLGELLADDVFIAGGSLSIKLDFGADTFDGADRWLEVDIKADADALYTTLAPRQKVDPTPYAHHAKKADVAIQVDDNGLPAIYTGAIEFTNAGNTFAGNGSGLTKLDASELITGNVNAARLPTGGTWALPSGALDIAGILQVNPAFGGVGIGTSSIDTNHKLRVETTNGRAILGLTTDPSGDGIYGITQASSGTGIAIHGLTNSPDGYAGYFEGGRNYFEGNVGVGTPLPLYPLDVYSNTIKGIHALTSASNGYGIHGRSTATTGSGVGVYGDSVSDSGWGVLGVAGSTSGLTRGGVFQVHSGNGTGVLGQAFSATGVNSGVWGTTTSDSGRGVQGSVTSATGLTYGGYFWSDSTGGRGLSGRTTASSGLTIGVVGQSNSTDGWGVLGAADATSGANRGVLGRTMSTDGIGVKGVAAATTGVNYGIYGQTQSASGYAGFFEGGRNYFEGKVGIGTDSPSSTLTVAGNIFATNGIATSTNGTKGLHGITSHLTGVGVRGEATGGSSTDFGGLFSSDSPLGRGVYGLAEHALGTNYGVYAQTNSPNGYAGYFLGGANYFEGNVGIGTPFPANKLSVIGDAEFTGSIGIGTSAPANELSVVGDADIAGTFHVVADGNPAVRIESASTNSETAGLAISGARSANTVVDASYLDLRNFDEDEGAGTEYALARIGAGMANFTGQTGFLRFYTNEGAGLQERMRISETGLVGIGTSNPQADLHVEAPGSSTGSVRIGSPSGDAGIMGFANIGNRRDIRFTDDGIRLLTNSTSSAPGSENGLIIDESGHVGIRTASPGAFFLAVNGSAAKVGGGSWSVFSDARLKRDIEPLAPGTLDRLLALHGYMFEYLDDAIENRLALPGRQRGLIAQEVAEVFPDWVDEDDEGYLYITERGLTAIIVEAMRELRDEKDAEIAEQQTRIEQLRAVMTDSAVRQRQDERIATLEARLAELEALIRE